MIDNSSAPYAALSLRLLSGGLFLAHGLMKIVVFTIPGTVGYFESLGLPGSLAYLVIVAELFAGVALVLGVATRTVALATVPILLGALWANAGNGWAFSNTGGGWEFPLFWIAVQIAIALLGSGAHALVIHRALPAAPTA